MSPQFNELNLRPELVQATSALGYIEPTPIQAGMIPVLLTGVDAIGQAQTGTGKTAAFALPILNNIKPGLRAPQALVLTPTRELALQVAEATTSFGQFMNAQVCAIYGGSSYSNQLYQLKRGVDVVIGTPGRLLDLIQRGSLDISQVRIVVLDEADEMLSMGFVEDIETILAETPAERQTALFSATMPAEIRRLAEKYMREPQSVVIKREQMTVDTVEQRYYLVNENDKTAALTRLFEVEEISSALIFARTRIGASELANELNLRGFPAEVLSGDLSQDARERTLRRFRENQLKVLVATDVAARGLDIDDISHVFNFDLPDEAEVYVHRIGRTGRAGKTGIAISLVTPREKRRLREVERFTRAKLTQATLPTEADIRRHRESKLLNQIEVWLQRGRCKRERELVEKLVEMGHDPLDVAAVSIKLSRAEEKQRPIASVSPVVEFEMRPQGSRFDRNDRRPRFGEPANGGSRGGFGGPNQRRNSHEQGMVRLSLNIGKVHGIRPADIVGSIAFHADIPGNAIGKITIQDQHTLVDVPETAVGRVLAKNGAYNIRKQGFVVETA